MWIYIRYPDGTAEIITKGFTWVLSKRYMEMFNICNE